MNHATDEDYLRQESVNDMDRVKATDVYPSLAKDNYEPSTGCWIDDRWGQYGVTRLIEIAQEYGFGPIDECEQAAVNAYRRDQATFKHCGLESYVDDWILDSGGIADAAEDWLNENVAKDGFSFGWADGEFFLMDDSWWESIY